MENLEKNDKRKLMFDLYSEYQPTGDQPEAIKSIIQGLKKKAKYQCLRGVTGSG